MAMVASAALHLALAFWSGVTPQSPGAPLPTPPSSVLFTASLSPPQAATAERSAPHGDGGGNSERPGHAESVILPASEDLPVPPSDANMARLRAGDSLNLPTDRTIGSSDGQRATQKDPRQARSESSGGSAERGGDDCRVAGFRFCSS